MKKINKDMVIDSIPIRDKETYKNKMGRVLCVGGNQEKGGAIIMSGLAALYSGVGLVTVASDSVNLPAIHMHAPEIMFVDMFENERLIHEIKDKDVIVIGPGLGQATGSIKVLETVLEYASSKQVLILDADAITLIAEDKVKSDTKAYCIYTPHIGEWERLSGLSKADITIEDNQRVQKELNATVILKGAPTRVYINGEVWENPTGNPSQATGGMGDTLTGILAGFIGQITNTKAGVLSAVYIHSYIADLLAKTHYVTLPTQIIKELPIVMRTFAEAKNTQD